MKYTIFFIAILYTFLFSSCGPNYIFDQEKEIAKQEWSYDNTIDFEVEIKDTTKVYNLYLDFEHSTNFPKQNLYVQIHTKFPDGNTLKKQVSFDFADRTGKWHGDCSSELCKLQTTIQEGAYFNQVGKYTFTLEQFMRINPLPAIKSIALKVEETELKR